MTASDAPANSGPAQPPGGDPRDRDLGPGTPPASRPSRAAAIIVTVSVAAIVGLSLWYLVQRQPLLVQGEADATRVDIAARVDGRVGQRPVDRGDNVAAGQVLVAIDNPELLTKLTRGEGGEGRRRRPTWCGSRSAREPKSLPSARRRWPRPRPL